MTDPIARDHAEPAHGQPAQGASAHDRIDPERPRGATPFDKADHFTGETYDQAEERDEGRRRPAGQEDRVAAGGDPATPPEGDNRASFDPVTGAVKDVALPEDGGLPSPPHD
ncbi:MAG: hypothetical protein ACRYFW_10615 [Janthinobacterium lividum]